MSNRSDLLQAKQTLSARLLRAGLRGGVIGRGHSVSLAAAVSSAGQNVHAVGVGSKIVEGEVTPQPCVRIYVIQKIAPSLLSPRDTLPESVDGVPTDIIQSPPAFLMARGAKRRVSSSAAACTDDRKKRQRPVVAGISTAHFEVTAGTISYFCRSTRHGDDPAKVYVLSNNHVLANVNQAQIDDELFQHAPADGGTISDHFANLHRFVPLHLGGLVPNRVDAAIGELLPGIVHKLEICKIGKITGTAQAVEGMKVRKHGRTTGFTEGFVSDETYDTLVGMDHNNPNVVALFENQMRIEKASAFSSFGLGGDSGSLVIDKERAEAVGLYNAGPDSGEYGVANHIADVLAEMQIVLL